jgi:hypothetical protein
MDSPLALHTMNQSPQTNSRWWLAAAVFSFGLLALLFPLLTLQVGPKWDALDQFLPAFTYLADSIRQGGFPLWDPFTNCGYPFHAEPQYNTFNPLALTLGLLIDRPALGFVWFWALHWLWGGLGMQQLARHFGASPLGAVTAAASYALCGFFIGHAQHTPYILVAAWLPWIFTFADKAVANSSVAFALLAGAAIGLCAYGGYPGLVLFTCLALALWLCLRFLVFSAADDPRPLSRRALWVISTLAVVGVLLLLIWAPKLNAFFLEGRGYTDRVGQLDPETANLGHPFTVSAAISLFFPFATIVGREWMGADISMTNGYVGILGIPLAVFWFWKRRGGRRPWWLLGFAAFMLLVSLGGEYGLRSLLYEVYPPMRYMRFSAPFRLFWMLPAALAAGLAVSQLARHPEDRPALLKVLLLWTLGAVAAAAAFVLFSPVPGVQLTSLLHRLFLPGISILLAAAFLVWFLSREGGWRRQSVVPVMLAALVSLDMSIHLYNNAGTVWSRGDVVEELEARHSRSLVVSGAPLPRLPGRPFGYLNAQQVVKVPLVRGYVTMQTEGFNETLFNSRFTEILSSAPRYWLSPGVERPMSPERALADLAKTGAGRPVPVFLNAPPASLPATRVVPGTFGSVKMLSYAPERLEMLVRVPGLRPAFLASTERYAAGWKVFIDGVPKRVWKTNLYFRGTLVPPGSHKVVWKYAPRNWQLLVALSYFALATAAGVAAFLLWRESRKSLEAVDRP